ncbi:MAG: hypothetical protein EPO39_11860 [Candidatus Manganitrophaceae bacterium]|nr:MAG: hypothetical protein EPO39_11860 [Candidatus Manganitrophaceae bacterium]
MKIYKTAYAALIVASIGIFAAMPAFSADRPSGERVSKKEVGQEVKEAVEAIKEYSADQRDEAVKKGKAVLDHLDGRIEQMESKLKKEWDHMSESTRKTAKTSLEGIKKQREKVAEWYGSLKESSAGAWENTKKGFLESYQAVHDSFDKVADKF